MLLPTVGVSVCIPVPDVADPDVADTGGADPGAPDHHVPDPDAERFLAEAVRSVLDQTYRDLELVVVGSGVDAAALPYRDSRIRVERVPAGLSGAATRNRAVELARAPLVKVVRPQDVLHPRCVELQAGRMEDDPGLALVAARRHVVDEHTRVLVPRRGLTGLTGLRTAAGVARHLARTRSDGIGGPSAVLFRREDFAAAGGWQADSSTADLDLWVRLLQNGEFLGLPEPLAAVRIGGPSAPADRERAVRERRELLEELGRSEFFGVRALDRTVGRVLAPVGWLRRRAVSAVGGARRSGATPPSG